MTPQAADLGSSAIAAGAQLANGLINQAFAEHNRKRNYYWNEKAADAADQRQREQYKDLYSPQAMLDQYAAAGLSPSMMMSGGQSAVGGNPQGAQGAGISGAYPAADLFNPNAIADVALKKAQIRNLDEDTTTKEIDNEIKKLDAGTYKNQWTLLNNTYWGEDTNVKSWNDLVNTCENYDEFESKAYKILDETDSPQLLYSKSEEGQKTLRAIYEANKKFSNDIAVLANSEENANLLLPITKKLNSPEFIEANYNAQLGQLRQIAESTQLTTKQKQAFNDLIDKMGNGTMSDIVVVLLMMLGNFAHANLNFGMSQVNSIKK